MSVLINESHANNGQPFWKPYDDPTAQGPTGSQGATGPQGPPGFTTGAVYFFNRSVPSDIPGYYVVSRTPVIGGGTTLTATGAGTQFIGSFATVAGDPGTSTIPAGNWNFETWINMSSNGGTPLFYVELYSRTTGGVETLVSSSVLSPLPVTQGTIKDLYFYSLAVPQTLINTTDRLVFKYYASGLGGRTMTVHFEDADIAQVITSLSAGTIGPTGPAGDPANAALWANYAATGPVNMNNKDITNGGNAYFGSLDVAGPSLFPFTSIDSFGNIVCPNLDVGSSGLQLGDLNVYGTNNLVGDNALYVEGGTSLSGNGIIHGVHIGSQTIAGVDLTRIDVLPVGIDVVSDTYIVGTAAGAVSWSAGGAVSLAGGSFIEMNTGSVNCVNSTSGDQATTLTVANILAPPSVAATNPLTIQNTAGGGVRLQGVTQVQGSSCAMTGISTINGNGVVTYATQEFREVQANGVSSVDNPASYTASFTARTLNNSIPALSGSNSITISGMSKTGNQITVPAGTYFIQASTPAISCLGFQSLLWAVTGSSNVMNGFSAYSPVVVSNAVSTSAFSTVQTFPVSTVVELQQKITSSGAASMGRAAGVGSPEIYSYLSFSKIA